MFSSSGHSDWARGGHGTYADTIQVTFRTLAGRLGQEGSLYPGTGRVEIWSITRSGHFSTKKKASLGWSQHTEQRIAKEIPETLDEANPEAWPTTGFPVRRVNEFPSCLNQCELGFLLYAAGNILNDKADSLILQSQMEEHFKQRELHVQDTEARQVVACSKTENLVNNIAITV